MDDGMITDLGDSVRFAPEELKIFEDVDEVIGKAVTVGDPLLAFEFGEGLIKTSMVKGLAMAKLLYRLQESWNLFKSAGIEDDLETMAYVHMGVKPATTRKYVRMWAGIFENATLDAGTKLLLQGRPIKELLLLTAAVREGSLEGDDLKAVALGAVNARDAIRDRRGEATSSKTAIRIFLQMQDVSKMPAGTLFAMQDGVRVVIGSLQPDGSDLAEKAIARIINAAGITENYKL